MADHFNPPPDEKPDQDGSGQAVEAEKTTGENGRGREGPAIVEAAPDLERDGDTQPVRIVKPVDQDMSAENRPAGALVFDKPLLLASNPDTSRDSLPGDNLKTDTREIEASEDRKSSGRSPAGEIDPLSDTISNETSIIGQPKAYIEEEDTQPLRIHPAAPPAQPPLGKTPQPPAPPARPVIHPLPNRVNEIDVDATRVTPAAYSPPAMGGNTPRMAQGQPTARSNRPAAAPRPATPPATKKPTNRGRRTPPPPAATVNSGFSWSRAMGCLLRLAVVSLFGLVVIVLCLGSFAVYEYFNIARTLPDVAELRQKASQFETTRILDRNGNVLYEILDPTAGRRTYVPLSKISPYMVAATIATEDKGFYSHPGFDLLAIFRAFLQNYQSGDIASGASTITQQLARNLLFTPEERNERTYQRKIREAILAAEITRRYTKDEILELYLNENYYGNLAYGVEAGSETYFGVPADQLNLSQSAFLAGLPQAPSVYDVYTNREQTLKRQEDVLVLMYEASQESGCIYVSNSAQKVCMEPVMASQAAQELKNYEFRSPDVQMRYPHWVNFVRTLLENQFDAQTIYRSGFTVYTTLDPGLQDLAEGIVKKQVESLAEHRVSDGALVAIRPVTGEILALVGSADFYDERISGQVNMALAPRQPGSSIKPLTYVAAFEKGWTPATLIWDVPSEFTPSGKADDPSPAYKPVNYDDRFHGPVTVRTALANSYNIPAVKTLNFVGIYDDPNTSQPDGFVNFAKRLGITSLNRPDYGLSLTLGGGDVSLLELTDAYATFANGGRRVPPVAITRILDHAGNVVYQYQPPAGEQVVRPEHAYLISSILSDNEARAPMFGRNSVLNLPFPAAAKTGTTNDFRDNWTLGYTPDVAVGVWVGNADYTPMQDTTGLTGAAPIWAEFMPAAVQSITGGNSTPFNVPAGVVEYVICEISGTQPSEWCPKQRGEVFTADQPPLPKEQDLWQQVTIDTWTALKASAECSQFTDDVFVLNVTDPFAKKWIKKDEQGKAWVEEMNFEDPVTFTPDRECKSSDPRPQLAITSPREDDTISSSPLDIFGQADATGNFDYFQLEWGPGEDPIEWEMLEKRNAPLAQPDKITSWDLSELPAGKVTLRLWMHSSLDTFAEVKLHLNLQVPTPTPTPTPTATATSTPTLTPTNTPTLIPTDTPTVTPIPSETPVPSNTPVPTSIPTAIPSETASPSGFLVATVTTSPTSFLPVIAATGTITPTQTITPGP